MTDPALRVWRTEALKRGYASSIALPLIAEGRTYGAITMYASEADAFDTDEVKLLKELADDIAYCISALRLRVEHKRTDEELRKHRQHLEEMVEKRTEELRKLSEELSRSNADLQQFAYIASHDLQAPLRNIEGFVQLLARRYRDKLDEKADEFINFITTGVKEMQALILDILEYSKVGSAAETFKKTDISLCVAKAISNLKETISEKQAEIICEDKFPVVSGDRAQLTSLFQNLIGNAIKFCNNPPKIHVSVESKGAEHIFSVKDNGIGIKAKDAERIFAIFHRLHSKSEYHGTGIGLAICMKIVERHGGRIWVESEPEKGSTFFFTLPVRE